MAGNHLRKIVEVGDPSFAVHSLTPNSEGFRRPEIARRGHCSAGIDDDFLHTQFWALVNRNGDVIKIYDGLKKDEIKELIKDIEITLKEKD